jgi:hypothetical protein
MMHTNHRICSIGSAENIDADSSRSRVIRFTLDGNYPKAYANVQVFGMLFKGRQLNDINNIIMQLMVLETKSV